MATIVSDTNRKIGVIPDPTPDLSGSAEQAAQSIRSALQGETYEPYTIHVGMDEDYEGGEHWQATVRTTSGLWLRTWVFA